MWESHRCCWDGAACFAWGLAGRPGYLQRSCHWVKKLTEKRMRRPESWEPGEGWPLKAAEPWIQQCQWVSSYRLLSQSGVLTMIVFKTESSRLLIACIWRRILVQNKNLGPLVQGNHSSLSQRTVACIDLPLAGEGKPNPRRSFSKTYLLFLLFK